MNPQRIAASVLLFFGAALLAPAACSLFNREGPEVTCAQLKAAGKTSECKEGIIASCPSGTTVTYKVCDEKDVCEESWQVPAGYRCDEADSVPCGVGFTECDGACVDTQRDSNNCGGCDNFCDELACVSGQCACPGGTQECDGFCVDTQTDASNCGFCGNFCLDFCESGNCLE